MSDEVRRLSRRLVGISLIAFAATSLAVISSFEGAGASAPPSVTVTPAGSYHDGQSIAVHVGPNGFFTPHSRIVIIECADPGGQASNLPRDITTCDGNTIQGATVLVGSDGSFSVSSYQVYALPSATLGEQPNYTPVCNQTNYCVLYVGQNQNDFTAPKVFSTPFVIAPSAGTASAGAGSNGDPGTAGTATGTSQTGVSAGVSLATSAALANTGPPAAIEWIVVLGSFLLICGAFGRRRVLRGTR